MTRVSVSVFVVILYLFVVVLHFFEVISHAFVVFSESSKGLSRCGGFVSVCSHHLLSKNRMVSVTFYQGTGISHLLGISHVGGGGPTCPNITKYQ